MARRWLLCMFALVALAFGGCISDSPEAGPLGGSRTVTGTVVDFQTNEVVDGAASVSTSGVVPAPIVTTQGATFRVEGVPDNSTFQVLASVAPTHRPTFGPSIDVLAEDISGVEAPVVSEAFLESLATAFAITPSASRGVLLARLVDEAGDPVAGVPGGELIVPGAIGPFFLAADLTPDPGANQSSASGYVVFFEVQVGVVELAQAAAPTVTLAMPASPIAASAVTLARIVATNGAPEVPTNVSFSATIRPIFTARGCIACHSGGGIGFDLGGLKLDGPAQQLYSELVEEDPTRVNRAAPAQSLVLRMPSREDPPDTHPNVTFASTSDPDYIKILVWIEEGALEN